MAIAQNKKEVLVTHFDHLAIARKNPTSKTFSKADYQSEYRASEKSPQKELENKIDNLIDKMKPILGENIAEDTGHMLRHYLDTPLILKGVLAGMVEVLNNLDTIILNDTEVSNLKRTIRALSEEDRMRMIKGIFNKVSEITQRPAIISINARNMFLYAISPDGPKEIQADKEKGVIYSISSEGALDRFSLVLYQEYKNTQKIYPYLEETVEKKLETPAVVISYDLYRKYGDLGRFDNENLITYIDVHLNKSKQLPTSGHESYHVIQNYNFMSLPESPLLVGAITVIEGGAEFFEASFMNEIVLRKFDDRSLLGYLENEMRMYSRPYYTGRKLNHNSMAMVEDISKKQPIEIVNEIHSKIRRASGPNDIAKLIGGDVMIKEDYGFINYRYVEGIALAAILFAYNGFGNKGRVQTLVDMSKSQDSTFERIFMLTHEAKDDSVVDELSRKFK